MNTLFAARIKRSLTRFFNREEGSIAPIVGLSMLGICVAIGAAIDYGRVTNAQARLGAAMDAAVIQVANQKTGTLADLKTLAQTTMQKNYGTDDYDAVSNFDLTGTVGAKLKASATVRVKTWFMSIVGFKYIDIPVAAEASAEGGMNVEVSLVLDNTGSMAWVPGADRNPRTGESSRLDALKNAANSFVDTVVSDDQSTYFSKVSIAPYATNVNPGTFLPMSRVPLQNTTCTNYSASPLCNKYKISGVTYTAQNCVTERQGTAYNTDDDMVGLPAMPEYVNTCNTAAVQLLTSNKPTLHTLINSMGANNGTAGHIGIQWGYQLLSPKSTLYTGLSGTAKTEGQPQPYATPKLKKVMVIMTDGEFNATNCNGFDNGTACNNSNGDTLLQAAAICNNAKSHNIEIYFINLTSSTPSSGVQTMMNGCSTDASHIILASDAAALQAAFNKIAEAIRTMRLTM